MITFLEYRDRRVLIRKWLNAGVMERHRCRDAAGRDCQPLRTYSCTTCLICGSTRRPKVPDGQAIIVRDDIVVGFQHKRDAEQYLRDVRERPLWSHPDNRRVRPVRHGELPEARVRLPGFQALLHEDPDRTVQARSQNGSQGPASRRGFANDGITTYGRSANGESVKAGSTTSPFRAVHVPSEAETPVDAGDTPPLPTPPLQLEAIGAHDRTSLAAHPSPMAGPAVCRQAPDAGWISVQVRICAGGAQQCAFLPRRKDT